MPVPMPDQGPRLLCFGRYPDIAARVQDELRAAGFRSTNFALTDDAAGDERLRHELADDSFDAVVIGGHINGQAADDRPDDARTAWFTRVLNIVHAGAPGARFVLIRRPGETAEAVRRVLG